MQKISAKIFVYKRYMHMITKKNVAGGNICDPCWFNVIQRHFPFGLMHLLEVVFFPKLSDVLRTFTLAACEVEGVTRTRQR
jgi:hypothetical protein